MSYKIQIINNSGIKVELKDIFEKLKPYYHLVPKEKYPLVIYIERKKDKSEKSYYNKNDNTIHLLITDNMKKKHKIYLFFIEFFHFIQSNNKAIKKSSSSKESNALFILLMKKLKMSEEEIYEIFHDFIPFEAEANAFAALVTNSHFKIHKFTNAEKILKMNNILETVERKKILIIPIGIPDSNKSMYLIKNYGKSIIIRPDEIRKKLTGNILDYSQDSTVWKIVLQRINNILNTYGIAVLDAMDINFNSMINFLSNFNRNEIKIIALVFNDDAEILKNKINKNNIFLEIINNQLESDIIKQQFDKIVVVGENTMKKKDLLRIIREEIYTLLSEDSENLKKFLSLVDSYEWYARPVKDLIKTSVKNPKSYEIYEELKKYFNLLSEPEKKIAYEKAKQITKSHKNGGIEFYIPQYFLFKKFFEDPTWESENYERFLHLLDNHDWWYEYSDDNNSYQRGQNEEKLMAKLWKKLSDAEKKDCFEKYCQKFKNDILKKEDPWRIGTGPDAYKKFEHILQNIG